MSMRRFHFTFLYLVSPLMIRSAQGAGLSCSNWANMKKYSQFLWWDTDGNESLWGFFCFYIVILARSWRRTSETYYTVCTANKLATFFCVWLRQQRRSDTRSEKDKWITVYTGLLIFRWGPERALLLPMGPQIEMKHRFVSVHVCYGSANIWRQLVVLHSCELSTWCSESQPRSVPSQSYFV